MNDIHIAKLYIRKVTKAEQSGHEFTLTFNQYKRLMLRKTCYYSGIPLTPGPNPGETATQTSRTLDRIDNSLGYIEGNVVAACRGVNQFKATLESEDSIVDFNLLSTLAAKFAKHNL